MMNRLQGKVALVTGAGRLPFKGIIHVAGINAFWFATARSIRGAVRGAMTIVNEQGFGSVAFPVIGAGSGSCDAEKALGAMLEEFAGIETEARVLVVRWRKGG